MPINTQRRVIDGLELISCAAAPGHKKRPPLLFVHGAFSGAWVWEERFMPLFAQAGYDCYALSLRGHGGSHGAASINHHSIRDYVDDVATVVDEIGTKPILIGHSMGGFVVQKFLEHNTAQAAVLMSSVPPQGLMAASFNMMMQSPSLLIDVNNLMNHQNIDVSAAREALFAKPLTDAEVSGYINKMSMESQRAMWDMTMFNLVSMSLVRRTPLFVLGSDKDKLIPAFLVGATARSYGIEPHIFKDFGHGYMLEPGSEVIVEEVVKWLGEIV